MPWKETHVSDGKVRFIAELLRDECSFAELCREFGISRKTGYKWRARYAEQELDGLEDRSHAPHSCPHAVSAAVRERLLAVRVAYPRWGPRTILDHLVAEDLKLPAEQRTVWPSHSWLADWLRRGGLTVRRRRRSPGPGHDGSGTAAVAANDVWCMDFKGWFRTLDGRRCDPFTLQDQASRCLLRCVLVERADGAHVQPVLAAAFREYGLPRVIRSDNGPPFGTRGLAGLSELAAWLVRLGVRPEYSRPGKPQDNGRLERLHRTLKEDTAAPPAATWIAQQRRLLAWRTYFNEVRPHQALAGLTPATLYAPSPRRCPRREPRFVYPPPLWPRLVNKAGLIRWERGHIDVGQVLAGQQVGLLELGDPEARYLRLFYQRLPLAVYDERYGCFVPDKEAKHLVEKYPTHATWHW